jgi:hypothetical protein
MTAQEIVKNQIEGWGERELYLVTEEEFEVLLSAGGCYKEMNTPNGDGTFFSSLVFQGKTFCTSTQNPSGA